MVRHGPKETTISESDGARACTPHRADGVNIGPGFSRIQVRNPGPSQAEDDWLDALSAAGPTLAHAGPGACLFVESREDVRATCDGKVAPSTVHTTLRGISARRGLDDPEYWHLSDPSHDAAEALAALAAGRSVTNLGRGTGRVTGGTGRARDGLDTGRAGEVVHRLAERARDINLGRAVRGRNVRIRAVFVAHAQTVWVASVGRSPVRDVRVAGRSRLEVSLERRGRRSCATGELVGRSPDAAELDRLAGEVAERAAERLGAVAPPAGETPVVLAPGLGGILAHELVGHALEADGARFGRSLVSVAPPELRVIDDPRRGRSPWRVDDEGEPARATLLLGGGSVGRLVDRRTARRLGVRPTGHARRASFREPVRPRMGCTFIASGPLTAQDVLEHDRSTIYIRRMEAASIDLSAGEATFLVTDADRLSRGRRVEPLTSFLIKVEADRTLRQLWRVADDLAFDTCVGTCLRDGQPLATSVGAPTIGLGVVKVLAQKGSELGSS